ncbi:MAG TPA: DNA polymerase III subunit delta, partial [Sedimentisphaerales bacterium]|nr:DNA polymerase III subunit delta [Sedimentisphaerales bacterium]
RECSQLLDELIPENERDLGLVCPDAAKAEIADVLDELRTPGLLMPGKVVLLRDADQFVSEHREILERYFDKPCPAGTLILSVSTWPGNTKLAKKLSAVGRLVSANEIKPPQLPDFIAGYAMQTYGKTMTRAASGLLIELVGDEPGRLAAEVDKLALFAHAAKAITADDIKTAVGRNRLFDVFEVISAMTLGDTETAVARLRNMFRGERDAEYTVVGAFAWHFRRMFQAKAALARGANSGEIAGKLRIWNDKEGFFSQLRRVSLGEIGSILRQLAAIDHAAKFGQAAAPVAIEQLVVSICAKQKQTAPAEGRRR